MAYLRRKPMKHILVLIMAWPLVGFASNRPVGKSFATRSEVIAQHGMACTSQPLATQAAIDVLRQGGSAVDAAIAANAVLGVVEPPSCGIGGDLFAIVWDTASGKLHGLNASGRSPRALTLAMLKTNIVDGKPIEMIQIGRASCREKV